MSEAPHLTLDEIDDLLVRRATEGLDTEDQQRYDALVASDPTVAEAATIYELAAASADVALQARAGWVAALPAELRDRLRAGATAHTGTAAETSALKLTGTPSAAAPVQPRQPLLRTAAFGWVAAAAALIALAFVIAQPPKVVERTVEVPVDDVDPGPTTLAEQYDALSIADGTVHAAWGYNPAGGDERFADATGEVIFNADQQTGYMKLTGLPVNDPTAEQYQLWIVDASRSGSENTDRVDGGVFNVTASGEVLIPIDAKLDARQPVVFAITVEKPGGVVESKGPLHVVAVVE